MNIQIVKLDGSKYPYKSKKKRIYNKWVKKHTIQSWTAENVVPTSIGMHQDENGSMIVNFDYSCKKII